MAGLNADLEEFCGFLQSGINDSGLKLKTQGEQDADGYAYNLVQPQVFLHAYPNQRLPIANLPSVLVTLDEAEFGDDVETLRVTLTIGVWDAGVHRQDVFNVDRQTIPAFTRGENPTPDLLTFADVLIRHLRRNGKTAGVDSQTLTLNLLEDDDLQTDGFRFGRIDVVVTRWIPSVSSLTGEEQAEDDDAPSIEAFL